MTNSTSGSDGAANRRDLAVGTHPDASGSLETRVNTKPLSTKALATVCCHHLRRFVGERLEMVVEPNEPYEGFQQSSE